MDICSICENELDRIDLSAAMFEGQVVRDVNNREWGGHPVCSRCFSLVEMGQLALHQILQLAQEKNWRLAYAIWLFDLTVSGRVISSAGGVSEIELDNAPGRVQIYTEATPGDRLRLRSQSGVWVTTGQSAAPVQGEELPDSQGL